MILTLFVLYAFIAGLLIVAALAVLRFVARAVFDVSPERLRMVVPVGYALLLAVPAVSLFYVSNAMLDTHTSDYRQDVYLAFGMPIGIGIAPWLLAWWALGRFVWRVKA